VTGASSSDPALAGSSSVTVTLIVGSVGSPVAGSVPLLSATVPTVATFPLTTVPSGSLTFTAWSLCTRLCLLASRSIDTWRAVVVTLATGPEAGEPTAVGSAAMRTAPKWMATSPGATAPVSSRPSASCQALTAVVVAEVQSSSTVSSSAEA
jgi:hypothetical protein